MKYICFVSIGSNLGDRFLNIRNAISRLSDSFDIIKTSSFYYTESWGYKDDSFINCVLKMETTFTPVIFLEVASGLIIDNVLFIIYLFFKYS